MTESKTPSMMPHKGLGPFPAFRLTKGVMNASDGDLERSTKSCEKWAEASAIVVIVGLILEVEIACTHPPFDSFWEHWGAVIADVAVALGVAGEVLFGRIGRGRQNELSRRSKEKLANAIDRAAELERQLAPRELTKEQYDILQTLKGIVSVVTITSVSDFEATRFSAQIRQALVDAEIKVFLGDQRLGMVWTEIYIALPNPVADFRKDPLYSTFVNAKFSVGCGDRRSTPMADLPEGVPVIMVGQKAPASLGRPPYVFTLPPKADDEA